MPLEINFRGQICALNGKVNFWSWSELMSEKTKEANANKAARYCASCALLAQVIYLFIHLKHHLVYFMVILSIFVVLCINQTYSSHIIRYIEKLLAHITYSATKWKLIWNMAHCSTSVNIKQNIHMGLRNVQFIRHWPGQILQTFFLLLLWQNATNFTHFGKSMQIYFLIK